MVSGILQILTGEHAGRTFLLEGKMIIGRDSSAQIRINDRSISRKHAAIEQRGDGFFISDLGSQNGVMLYGTPITEGTLPPACKLQFGTVEAEFSMVEAAAQPGVQAGQPANLPATRPPDDAGWQSLPPDGASASLEDIFKAPKGLDEIEQRETDKKAAAQAKVVGLAYVGLMLLIVAAGVLIFLSIGRKSQIPRRTAIVYQTQEKLIPFPGVGKNRTITPEKPIASVEQDSEYSWLLKVKGNDVGETKAYINSPTGVEGILNIIVRGAPKKDQDDPRNAPMSEEERIQMARSLVMQGDQMALDQPWQAMQYYRRAEATCRPLLGAPEIRMVAATKARKMEKIIADKANRLMDDARAARNSNRVVDAARTLNEIRRLIPDPSDERHQRVTIILYMDYPELMHGPTKGG